MIYFHNDYHDMCHWKVLEKMTQLHTQPMPGYGEDFLCAQAAQKIRALCGRDDLAVHFLVGGTQTNLTVISAALRPHQAVVGADTAHINVHETGAIEATGHKVISLPTDDGKITGQQVAELARLHRESADREHMAQPKMVYISNPTELGTIYSLAELETLHEACQEHGLYLYVDGARLGYGLTAKGNDVTLADMARLCDVFYIGGTKCGAMFGEAVVISNDALKEDFRYLIKRHGGMLAKGWQLGAQFDALFENDLYFTISTQANRMADCIRDTLAELNIPTLVNCTTNQIFPILSDAFLEELGKEFTFTEMHRVNATHRAVRFCTSWATTRESVDTLCNTMREIARKL
jgi:threonine aldolase